MKPTINIKAATATEASAIYCAKRDKSGEGASTFPDGEWNGHRISYNGRIWYTAVSVDNWWMAYNNSSAL